MKNRKFWLFVIAVIALLIGAYLKLDTSTGIVELFAIYNVGNVSSKFAHKNDQ